MLGRYSTLAWIFLWHVSAKNQSSKEKYRQACTDQEHFVNFPPLQFSCSGKRLGGYYVDIESFCHIFHFCGPGYKGGVADHVFCCHPDLVFDQRFLVCDRPDIVDCTGSAQHYNLQFRNFRAYPELQNEFDEIATTDLTLTQAVHDNSNESQQLTRMNFQNPLLTETLEDIVEQNEFKTTEYSDNNVLRGSENTSVYPQIQNTVNGFVDTRYSSSTPSTLKNNFNEPIVKFLDINSSRMKEDSLLAFSVLSKMQMTTNKYINADQTSLGTETGKSVVTNYVKTHSETTALTNYMIPESKTPTYFVTSELKIGTDGSLKPRSEIVTSKPFIAILKSPAMLEVESTVPTNSMKSPAMLEVESTVPTNSMLPEPVHGTLINSSISEPEIILHFLTSEPESTDPVITEPERTTNSVTAELNTAVYPISESDIRSLIISVSPKSVTLVTDAEFLETVTTNTVLLETATTERNLTSLEPQISVMNSVISELIKRVGNPILSELQITRVTNSVLSESVSSVSNPILLEPQTTIGTNTVTSEPVTTLIKYTLSELQATIAPSSVISEQVTTVTHPIISEPETTTVINSVMSELVTTARNLTLLEPQRTVVNSVISESVTTATYPVISEPVTTTVINSVTSEPVLTLRNLFLSKLQTTLVPNSVISEPVTTVIYPVISEPKTTTVTNSMTSEPVKRVADTVVSEQERTIITNSVLSEPVKTVRTSIFSDPQTTIVPTSMILEPLMTVANPMISESETTTVRSSVTLKSVEIVTDIMISQPERIITTNTVITTSY
ncbi:uncharacterized protein LOC143258468 isoform X2 [Tachypleus tridentatus]|uniref:uncharacterized protein LOC143258468 isoform X2 n=1 Tax=Tachypleus tridentatus TaxID=6853 RepID=UPI003FD15B96